MANEITFGWRTGQTLTYGAYQPDGSVRTAAGTSLPEISSTGYYTASDASIQPYDIVIVSDSGGVIGWGEYKPYAQTSDIPSAANIADAVWDEATAGHTTAGTFGEQVKTDIDAILTATGSTPTAAAIADAVWDELAEDHTAFTTFGQVVGTSIEYKSL